MDRFRTSRANMNSICAFLIAFLSVMLLAGPGLARERPNAATLELTLEIGKPTLVLGEPVYATVRLVNAGVMPMDVSKLLDPQTGALQLEVPSSRRPRFVFLPLFYSDAVHARTPPCSGRGSRRGLSHFLWCLGMDV